MAKSLKVSIYFMLVALVMQIIPQSAFAVEVEETVQPKYEQAVLFANELGESISVYENASFENVIAEIPDDSVVEVLEANEEFSHITYSLENIENQGIEVVTGYVESANVVPFEEAEDYRTGRAEAFNEKQEDIEESAADTNKSQVEEDVTEPPLKPATEEQPSVTSEVKVEKTPEKQVFQRSMSAVKIETSTPILGIAKKEVIHVYASESTDKVLKSYQQGQVLKFLPHSDGWYQCTVILNGKPQTGYIQKDDIELIKEQVSQEGYALKQPVAVYEKLSTESKVLKQYPYGHLLKFKTLNGEWYEATIIVNATRVKGFIHHTDVGFDAPLVEGVALATSTKVYSQTSTSSSTLKSYAKGQILKYRSYNSSWFQATVYVNGKPLTGYIHKKDVDTAVTQPESLQGISIKSPTKVYQSATSSSKVLKSYSQGRMLKFQSFTKDWYKATVILNGKPTIGFISKADIGDQNTTLQGYVQTSKLHVYQKASASGSVLKSYKKGSLLKYRYYNSSWYEATVYVNGKAQTGYIQAKEVSAKAPLIQGYALGNPTTVYNQTSKSSTKLKTYSKGTEVKYRPYNKDWYQVTVYVNGKSHTGYIPLSEAGETAPSYKGYAHASPTYVYQSTNKASKKLKSYARGKSLQYRTYNKDWYVATVYINGKAQKGYIHRSDVGTSKPSVTTSYVNPNKVYTYSQMVTDIKKLQKAHPNLISYKVIGKSEYGRDIYAVSLGKGKPTTFINGSHHAREWITTNLNMYMLEQYANAYNTNRKIQGYDAKSILNSTTIWFVPMVNPDGVTLQQQGLKAFPKNTHASLIKMNKGSKDFKRWKANGKGVDLNRQYNAGWSSIKNNASGPSYQFYKGTAPASAAEVKAVVKFVNQINPEIAVSYHSTGQILYWNYLQTGARYSRDLALAKNIGKMTGYALVYPKGVPSGGGFTDWFISAKKRPAFTPEISRYYFETSPPLSEFTGAWRENQGVGLFVARESAKLYNQRKK